MKNNELCFYQQERHFWSGICKNTVSISDTAIAYFSELPIPAFSFIYLHSGASIADFKAGNALFFEQKKPYVLVVHEKVLPQLAPIMTKNQYENDGETTAMVLTSSKMVDHTDCLLPEGYRIALSNEQLTEWAQPLITAFAAPDSEDDPTVINEYIRYHQRALQRKGQLLHYVLFHGNTPVSALTLTLNGSMARLDDIGTDTQYQRQGLATLLIKHALKTCTQNGVERCFLEASSDGLSIYKKLGFTPLFRYHSVIVE
ncbi:GNAT family N-acetyltransferase [Providencia stuartii]|uniref:GNAT family N-acetyltransferase n=1 Tax=Providencia stuartii TaxID=588 RepID=UPI0004F703CF|nr:GNAT family N-acetyltransferase [Providencia stuartii]AIN65562.1 acetyltransferase family protein [Providencia stuartii]MBG5897866.1 GNAT family N-acetyltransferase [Providencia stuartii]MBK1421631.1 GNAT family N-acetyltransferase [Providencia stuartii]MDT7049806.1 GNAT family N-acetyltransferase [Providencia stuartii]MTB80396.1 GNAT family N-acetyltransferase [Providencia stuartii]